MSQRHKTSNSPGTTSAVHKRYLLECYRRGVHLATCEKNYDYAHAMFTECVLNDGGNLQFAEAMIQNLRAMKPRVRRSILRLHRRGSRAIKNALRKNDWNVVLRTGVERLKDDPWDVTTLRA